MKRILAFMMALMLIMAFFVFVQVEEARAVISLDLDWGDVNTNTAICTAIDYQTGPKLVPDGQGGAIIAWSDCRAGTFSYDLYAQRVNENGTVQWITDGIPISTATKAQYEHEMMGDGQGGAIITWRDRRGGGTDDDIYAQRVNENGMVQWTTNGIPICTTVELQGYPQLVTDGQGGAIITWFDRRSGSYDIYAQRVNATGATQWTANGIPVCTAVGHQGTAQLLGDGQGGAIITWGDGRSGGSDIYAQRVNENGTMQWTTDGIPIYTAANAAFLQLVGDGQGGAIITWDDQRSGRDIYAQRVNSTGAVLWSPDGIPISTAANNQSYPQLVGDDQGGAIISWFDYRNNPNGDIYSQRVNHTGTLLWIADGVAISTGGTQQRGSDLIRDGQGGAILTWGVRLNGTWSIYAQQVNSTGAVQCKANGILICTAASVRTSPRLVGDGHGGAIITWQDYRNDPKGDIYAQRIEWSLIYITTTNPVTSVEESSFYSYDFDSNMPSVELWGMTTNATGGWLSINATGVLSGTPDNADIGSYWVNVTVEDGNGSMDSLNFTLTVNNSTPPNHSNEFPAIDGSTSDLTPVISVHVTDISGVNTSTIKFYINGFRIFHELTPVPDGYNVSYWHEMGFVIGEVVICRIVAQDFYANELDFTWQFTMGSSFEIALQDGWNLVSFPLIPVNTSIEEVLSSISGQWDMVEYYDASDLADHWKKYATFMPPNLSDLWNLDNTMGFWLHVTNATTLVISGTEPVATDISLYAGWNLVGYPTMSTETVANALWGTGADKVEVFDPAEPYRIKEVGPTYVMRPGEGYWVHVPADTTWTIDW